MVLTFLFTRRKISEFLFIFAAINVILRNEILKRKIDKYFQDWKHNPKRKPLIVKGARQIGKTESIRAFGEANYESVIEINFLIQKKFRAIFDELQKCPDCATSLKSFCQDKRYDGIWPVRITNLLFAKI